MSAYELPTKIEVGGEDIPIRSDFRAVLDILTAMGDSELDDYDRQEVMLEILYVDPIPPKSCAEAVKKAVAFIDAGMADKEGKTPQRLMDWEQDAALIIPAVNKVAGREIRSLEYLHWWTFLGYFMEIGEGLFAQVVSIRRKKAKHKKLEKWEREFERENKGLVQLGRRETEEERRKRESLERWL